MFLLPIKLDRVSFETKGRQNLQKTADFVIESIVFCPLVSPSWISLPCLIYLWVRRLSTRAGGVLIGMILIKTRLIIK